MQAMEEDPKLVAEGKDPASDEEIARRLQQQLNGEAAAAARRRTRKQPTFYSPQSGGYSGYHGVEYASMEGEGREGEDAPEAELAAGASQAAGRRAEAEGAMPASPSARRGQPEASSPYRAVKEEEGAAPPKGSNSLSGRELRALMRSNPEKDAGTVDTKPGSTKGSSGRGLDSGAGSGSGGEGEAEVGTPRTSARRLKGKRQRSNLGQPQIKDEPGLKSKDSGMSSVDGESNSDNEDQSLGDPAGPPGKRRMRKIPKLPMVRHGKKWYRARLLKDSGQGRVQIEFTGFEEVSGSISLPRESDRIWRGSYKGKDWRYLGDGAWEPKERTSKKPTKASSNPKTSSRPTSSNAHAQQSSDAPSSAEDARAVNDPDPNEREAQSPRMMEPHHEGAATEPEQPQRKLSQKRAAPERADRGVKKGRLEPLDTQDIPQEAASPAEEQALSTGAVKPETPAKGMETKPAPGDAGTDSGTDDEAKLQSAAEQGLRIHRSRKAEAVKQKLAAPECTSEAAEALPAQRQAHQAAPESADTDNKTTRATAAAMEAAEEAATGEAAAMLASMASEEHGDETGLQCEEALPAEEHAGKSIAGSPSVPSSQARGAEQHLGWKFAWKKSQKKQADGASSDSGDKPSARVPEPTMSPKSLRPARRTRKPLKIDNPYDDASRQMTPAPAPSVQDVPMQSPFATPPDSEDEKEPEVRAPSSGRGRGGRRGGRAAQRGGRGRGGGRWAHHRAALAAAALNGFAAEDVSGNEGLHDAGSGVQPALAQRPVRTLKPSSKILAANHSNHSPSPPPTRRGRSASAGPNPAPLPASRGLVAFSGLMDAMSALDGPRASAGRLSNTSSQSWDSRGLPASAAGVQTLPAAWPGASLGPCGNPLFGGLEVRWRFNAHRKILEASEKLMPAQQPAPPSVLASTIAHPHPPPVPLFQ